MDWNAGKTKRIGYKCMPHCKCFLPATLNFISFHPSILCRYHSIKPQCERSDFTSTKPSTLPCWKRFHLLTHPGPHGKREAHFGESHYIFMSTPAAAFLSYRGPRTHNGEKDRFKMLFKKFVRRCRWRLRFVVWWKSMARKNRPGRPYIWEWRPCWAGPRREGKWLQKEQSLKEIGDKIRNLALKRSTRASGTDTTNGILSGWYKRRHRISYDSDEKATQAFAKDVKVRREQEDRRF